MTCCPFKKSEHYVQGGDPECAAGRTAQVEDYRTILPDAPLRGRRQQAGFPFNPT